MLKRNRNWRNITLFCHIFVIGKISIGGGRTPWAPPWLCLCSNKQKQKRFSQIFREVSGVFQRNFNCSENSAVLEPRTGQFSRTWGFEVKAKDFKMCSRGRPPGQGRFRGLQLCYLAQNPTQLKIRKTRNAFIKDFRKVFRKMWSCSIFKKIQSVVKSACTYYIFVQNSCAIHCIWAQKPKSR